MARLALADGDLDQAEQWTQQALALAPGHEASRQVEAQLLVTRGRLEEAIQRLESFRDEQPTACGPDTLVLLADLYRMRGDAARAEAALDQAARRAPEQGRVFLARQRLLASLGRFDDVLANVRGRMASHPRDVGVLAETAIVLAGSPDDRHARAAVTLLNELTRQAPNQGAGFRALALSSRRTGDLAAAEEAFRQVLRLEPVSYTHLRAHET